MRELQYLVAEFVRQHHLETDVAHRLLDAVSELGEVAKEVLKSSSYGAASFCKTKSWDEELGDVFFSLICVANTTGVDIEEAVKCALGKYERRIDLSGEASSGERRD